MNTNTLLFLSAADVRRALPMREAVDVMKAAFAALSAGEAIVPLRSHLAVPQHQGKLLLMPCCLPAANRLCLKVLTSADRIYAELGEITAGQKPGRQSEDEITFFKSVGVAIQDLAAAARILENARRLGLGTALAL